MSPFSLLPYDKRLMVTAGVRAGRGARARAQAPGQGTHPERGREPENVRARERRGPRPHEGSRARGAFGAYRKLSRRRNDASSPPRTDSPAALRAFMSA
ncbi:MAG: hypothetical protein QOC93_203 [Actinomycetota bacterium]|nr:hypothetical protein [Actinomycetota bacterium]